MPSRWELALPGVDGSRLQVEWLHAVVSSWFDQGAAEHAARFKGYAVSPPRPVEGGAAFEIGVLDDALVPRLLTAAAPGTPIRLGSRTLRLPRGPLQTAATTWPGLAVSAATRSWVLRFVTPVTFRRGNRFSPWPDPPAVLGGLRARWSAFAPKELPPVALDLSADPVWVTDVAGANEVIRVDQRIVSGFVGRVRWECDADDATASTVNSLLRLAGYGGVGAHTTRGFGVTVTERTWLPRAPRP
jgi:CRISPR-associated endoribonuclease Cas6